MKKFKDLAPDTQELILLLRDAAELAVFSSVLFAVSYYFECLSGFGFMCLISAVLSGVLCGLTLLSNGAIAALRKWALSIVFALAAAFVLVKTHFAVRAVNAAIPGYGRLSAGGGFALMTDSVCFIFFQAIAALAAIAVSGIFKFKGGRLNRIQNVILPVICIVIFAVFLCLEFTMPAWENISQSVYYG